MNMNQSKYATIKSDYNFLLLQTGGTSNVTLFNPLIELVLLHVTDRFYEADYNTDKVKSIIKKYGTIHEFTTNFAMIDEDSPFELNDMSLSSVAINIKNRFNRKIFLICIGHASPYGLYYSHKYPDLCEGIICFPLRLYSKESLDRRIWKFKDREGWKKYVSDKYDVDDYLINTNNKRLKEIYNDKSDLNIRREMLYLIFDFNLQKQHADIPTLFKVPTYLFSRLDMDIDSIVKLNYDRKNIADMKNIVSESDALYTSAMWNFHRVAFDKKLLNENEESNLLKIGYIISGMYDESCLDDALKIMLK